MIDDTSICLTHIDIVYKIIVCNSLLDINNSGLDTNNYFNIGISITTCDLEVLN